MSKKSISIKDIAKLAGVSIATVSRVINRNGKVAPETEKKILQVMEENHYVPNLLAKGFRTQKFTTIGIIVPDISIEFFSKIAKKVQTIFFERGYATIICNTNEDYKMERQCINMLQAQHVGGDYSYSLRYNREGEKDFNTYGLHRQGTGVWKHQKGYGSY